MAIRVFTAVSRHASEEESCTHQCNCVSKILQHTPLSKTSLNCARRSTELICNINVLLFNFKSIKSLAQRSGSLKPFNLNAIRLPTDSGYSSIQPSFQSSLCHCTYYLKDCYPVKLDLCRITVQLPIPAPHHVSLNPVFATSPPSLY